MQSMRRLNRPSKEGALLAGVFGGAFVAAQGIGDNPLNLSVDRPEFLSRPSLHLCHHLRVKTQQETFPFT